MGQPPIQYHKRERERDDTYHRIKCGPILKTQIQEKPYLSTLITGITKLNTYTQITVTVINPCIRALNALLTKHSLKTQKNPICKIVLKHLICSFNWKRTLPSTHLGYSSLLIINFHLVTKFREDKLVCKQVSNTSQLIKRGIPQHKWTELNRDWQRNWEFCILS